MPLDTLEEIVADSFRSSSVRVMGTDPAWESHASILNIIFLEDTGDLSNDNAFDDDSDSEGGLAAEPDKNDPYSVDWPNEDDVILSDIADGYRTCL